MHGSWVLALSPVPAPKIMPHDSYAPGFYLQWTMGSSGASEDHNTADLSCEAFDVAGPTSHAEAQGS